MYSHYDNELEREADMFYERINNIENMTILEVMKYCRKCGAECNECIFAIDGKYDSCVFDNRPADWRI